MAETENRRVVERLIACINDGKTEVMDDLFHEDAVMDWPQSGEQVVGAENRRAIYGAFAQLPTISRRRILSAGDLVVAEAPPSTAAARCTAPCSIFELRDGRFRTRDGVLGRAVRGARMAGRVDRAHRDLTPPSGAAGR